MIIDNNGFFLGESGEVAREERDSNAGHAGNDNNEYGDNLAIHGIDFIIAGSLEVYDALIWIFLGYHDY